MSRGALLLLGVVAVAAVIAGRPGDLAAQRARVGQLAPEVAGGPWINSPPLTMAGLRGRVVYVEFWTYG